MAEFLSSLGCNCSSHDPVLWSQITNRDDWTTKLKFAGRLRTHGWGIIHIDSSNEFDKIYNWESTFSKVFSLPKEMLEYAGLYRGEQGLSIGYRHDEERKFIECRMTTLDEPNPNYRSLEEFSPLVRAIYDVLCPVGEEILRGIAHSLGLDDRVFVELTDCGERGRLPMKLIERKKLSKATMDSESPAKEASDGDPPFLVPALSSSLLRICKYDAETQLFSPSLIDGINKRIAFGAHTDTSFLTLGLCSSNPAIEMADLEINEWISPEKSSPPNSIMIFVGEFLQVLTKDRFMASVHRVGVISSGSRISCPLIIREHPDKVIQFHDRRYSHPGGDAAVSAENVPDFDGMTLKMIHKLLELKRRKCFERNGSAEGNWVLSSFPIVRIPSEK